MSERMVPPDVQRLLAVVDERLGLGHGGASRGDAPLPSAPVPDHATFVEAEAIQRLPAPLFDPAKGGRLARFGKRLVNVPLRAVTTPQLYFNAALGRVLRGWAALLRSSADFQEALRSELADQRRRLDGMDARLRALADGHAASDGCRLELCYASGRRVVIAAPGGAAEVVGDLGALPVAAGTASELSAVGVLERLAPRDVERFLPHWRSVLRPGGCLRLRSLEPCTVYTPDVLLALLARAGFVDCAAHGARDGTAVEVVARRPATP